MKRKLLTSLGILILGASVSACGGGGGGGQMTTNPPGASAKFEDQFGGKFATAYQAGANTEPADVAAGDVLPVSVTAEPVPFPGT